MAGSKRQAHSSVLCAHQGGLQRHHEAASALGDDPVGLEQCGKALVSGGLQRPQDSGEAVLPESDTIVLR